MEEWREAAAAGDWSAIRWKFLSDSDQCELLCTLKASLPLRSRVDGYEKIFRHDTLKEALHNAGIEISELGLVGEAAERHTNNAVYGAYILFNLEAIHGEGTDWIVQAETFAASILNGVSGESQGDSDSEMHRETGSSLKQALPKPEHQPASELTRQAHAARALEHVKDSRLLLKIARKETSDDDNADWLQQMIRDAGEAGYWAGRRIQAAWGKPIEYEAVSNRAGAEKHIASKKGTEIGRSKTATKNQGRQETKALTIERIHEKFPSYSFKRLFESATKEYNDLQPREGGLSISTMKRYFLSTRGNIPGR